MKLINKKWTTIIEAIVVMLIIVMWVVWMYELLWNSQQLSLATKNRIEATQIAREWVEAVVNIRDTNWFLYSADYKNCWNTMNYDSACIWSDWNLANDPDWSSINTDILWWSYKIYKNTDNRWELSSTTTWLYSSETYRNEHIVSLDSNWFYTQSWVIDNLKPTYTREIIISYSDTDWNTISSDDEIMNITSLVQWASSESKKIHKVEIKNTITNWKNKKQ